MEPKRILIIHPYDKTTSFLNKAVKYIVSNINGKIIEELSVLPNLSSHTQCLEKLQSFNNNELVLYFGHGRSDKLYGAKSDSYGKFYENEQLAEENEVYYNDDFINIDNISVLRGKKIICLSCNSNGEIGKNAIINGAITFVGFGDIPTSVGEFYNHGVIVGDKTIAIMKSEINTIMKNSLVIALNNKYNFDEFKNLFILITNKRISDLLLDKRGVKSRRIIADFLFRLKSELTIYGNKDRSLLE